MRAALRFIVPGHGLHARKPDEGQVARRKLVVARCDPAPLPDLPNIFGPSGRVLDVAINARPDTRQNSRAQ